jgi:hypothetical protein
MNTKGLLTRDPDAVYRAQMAGLARECRNAAAKHYRRGRKCLADARAFETHARAAARLAARDPQWAETAATWRRRAGNERDAAPRWRARGAEAMGRARYFQMIADGDTAGAQAWAARHPMNTTTS